MDETNSTPQPIVPVETPKPQEPKSHMKMWGGLVILILVLGAAAYGAYWLRERAPMPTQQNPGPPPAPTPSQIPTPTPGPTPDPGTYSFLPKTPAKPPAVEGKVDGSITWHYPTDAGPADIVDTTSGDGPIVDLYDVGTFNTGKYQGKHLLIGLYSCNCMGGGGNKLTIVTAPTDNPKSYILLTKYSSPFDNFGTDLDKSKFSIDSTTIIPDLESPDQISGPGKNQSLVKGSVGSFLSDYILFNSDQLKLVFTDPKLGSVYTSPDGMYTGNQGIYNDHGYYVKAPDWSVWTYKVQPDFIGDDGIAQVTWSGGAKNTTQYIYTDRTGCGGSNYASVVSSTDVNVQTDLVVIGMTNKGDVIYGFKDVNNKIQKDVYDNQYYTYNGSAKIPYDQFVAKHPIFLWVDPFNRIIKFVNNDFVPQAECGKPVIYLYPTKTENVSVKLNPTGGFSYTEPVYGNGWNVTAQPNGQLTNLVDNKLYPYLFWEGRSNGIYQIPDKGFVVAKSEVHNLLNEKLAKLGLNAQETADFEEYWEPYMQSAPYYFVTFMGNSVMDQIAPLSVSPTPDTVIRILMDFKPLQQPIPVQGFEIKTPARNGFTVVEWGGVKH